LQVLTKTLITELKLSIIMSTSSFKRYYYLNDILWQEGFFFDFVQKKTIDNLVRKLFIFTAYLFGERVLFDKLVKVYSDLVLFLSSSKSIYEYNNVANMLMVLVFTLTLLILSSTFCFVLNLHVSILL